MRCNLSVSFLLAGMMSVLTVGQSVQVSPGSEKTGRPTAIGENADDPVITIMGFCSGPDVSESLCKTVVSRGQFDKLADALQPHMPIPLRLKVANAYARNLRMAAAAEARGLDKTPEFEEELRFARIQLLAQDLDVTLKAEANNISENDLADYYEKNKSSFEQATIARIFVPYSRLTPDATEAQKKVAADAMIKLAADLRTRAVQGEDMDKLQIEAYAQAGMVHPHSNTKLEKVRRATLPPQHESVMDLKTGEVSKVFSDPEGAHFIYKMIRKETLTLEQSKPEIRSAISHDRYRDSMKGFQGNVVFSDAYFNPPGKSGKTPLREDKTKADY